MRHLGGRHVAERVGNGIGRTIVEKADDTKLMQYHNLGGFANEQQQDIEHVHPYGFTSVVQAPTGSGQNRMGAEGFMGFMGGGRSHGVVFAAGDRRYRLYKLDNGEVAMHDDQGQQVHFKRDGLWGSVPNSKKIVMQVMDDDTMPQDDGGSGQGGTGGSGSTSSGQKMGQIKQAGRPSAVNMTLTKSKWTLNVPAVEINCQTMKCTVSDHFSTIGTTRLGQDDAAHPVYGANSTGKLSQKVFVNAVDPGPPTSLDAQP